MRSDSKKLEQKHTRVELKYCEHCGGLWIREGGGGVYCERCQPKVADLPKPKRNRKTSAHKSRGRAVLPVGRRTVVEDYGSEVDDENSGDMEAAGGVA